MYVASHGRFGVEPNWRSALQRTVAKLLRQPLASAQIVNPLGRLHDLFAASPVVETSRGTLQRIVNAMRRRR